MPNLKPKPPGAFQRAPNPAGTAPIRRASDGGGAGTSRLNKRMAELGMASRREADDWIARGWVRVDGQAATMGMQVAPGARIEIAKQAQGQQANQVTILVNKPMGIVSGQAEDGHLPAITLVQPHNRWAEDNARFFFHPKQLQSLVPAGRLDIDSIGLLVLTQDGRVARQLIGEDSAMEKEYLRLGLSLDGQALKPAKITWQNPEQLRVVLTEGKKRQIRRMCELVGLKVVGLKRVRIGNVMLGNLPLGQWRYLAPHERF
ncbi:MAG: rRNA pseudouridine synthase [Betaproteobacteria bacterium]|nr:rRNA pseudouridine synthase [Betaproteobacteria bacterium]